MIAGVGVDVVEVARLRRAIERTARFERRVFTQHELETCAARGDRFASLAARFAAKEAVRKALGASIAMRDIEVTSGPDGAPTLRVAAAGDLRLHVSLSHDAGVAVAFVVAERP